MVSGWGALEQGSFGPDALHGVNVPLITDAECKQAYGASSITSNMICAGDVADGGIDSCQGDSGGPLSYLTPIGYYVVGVVSWGAGCAQAGSPGVYAKVSAQLQWIKDQGVESASWCGQGDGSGDGSGDESGGEEPQPPSEDCAIAFVGDGVCDP